MSQDTDTTPTTDTADLKRGPFESWVNRSISNPENVYQAMFYLVTGFFLVTTLFPFYWLVVLALTPNEQIVDMGLLPKGTNVGAFVEVFQAIPFHRFVINSLLIATATTIIVLVLASLAGYVFGRLDFPGKKPLMLVILAISYFPPAAFLLPLFSLFTGGKALYFQTSAITIGLQSPDLYNSPWPMVMPFSALFLPLSIFILTTFYGQIPDGLEDAARIEGTTRLGALARVIVPLSAPGIATAGVLTFITVYNEYFFSSLMTNGAWQNWAPIVEGILGYRGHHETPYNLMAAASIVGVLPVAILVVVAQEKIVSGLTSGALKE
ncbi:MULTISPECIES: carbohydrate ABC transporter permease [unclassified Haladaptatus]|uniref:carbohydrate ABC transporter permease n=1 Tax=unclassified Haladaptatus TaxID=2622732 RepID=UPI0023E7E37D|nr:MULTISPECIES: carbohydrate ABC transporter permease [unclassified Haladaptatus]